jgi:DNA replication protein DnaC
MVDHDLIKAIKAKIVTPCEKCGGEGYLGHDDDGFLLSCECIAVIGYIIRLMRAEIPLRYWNLKLEELGVEESVLAFTKKYAASLDVATAKALGILYTGATGIGKTSLACEVLKAGIIRQYPVRYMTVRDYLDQVFANTWDGAKDIKILVLDEIDKVAIGKNGTKAVLQMVEDCIRSNAPHRSVIACCNMDLTDLLDHFGPPTVSLIQRSMKTFRMEGIDYGGTVGATYDEELMVEYDYMHPNIVEAAVRWSRSEYNAQRKGWGYVER